MADNKKRINPDGRIPFRNLAERDSHLHIFLSFRASKWHQITKIALFRLRNHPDLHNKLTTAKSLVTAAISMLRGFSLAEREILSQTSLSLSDSRINTNQHRSASLLTPRRRLLGIRRAAVHRTPAFFGVCSREFESLSLHSNKINTKGHPVWDALLY